jgi:hypothetical protein
MSSVTRFIRQVPVSTTYYDAGSVLSASPGAIGNAYAFVPDASNYVGNYTPGSMVNAAAASTSAVGSGLFNLITTTIAGTVGGAAGLILRDMGKTIKAAYTNAAGTLGTDVGFFREVQLLNPKALGLTTNTVIGGVNGSNFGVIGPSPDYLTFYIPVTVAGVRGPVPTQNAYAVAGGQM